MKQKHQNLSLFFSSTCVNRLFLSSGLLICQKETIEDQFFSYFSTFYSPKSDVFD